MAEWSGWCGDGAVALEDGACVSVLSASFGEVTEGEVCDGCTVVLCTAMFPGDWACVFRFYHCVRGGRLSTYVSDGPAVGRKVVAAACVSRV